VVQVEVVLEEQQELTQQMSKTPMEALEYLAILTARRREELVEEAVV
jgi:hypothetical protein